MDIQSQLIDAAEFCEKLNMGCRSKSPQVALKYLEFYAKLTALDSQPVRDITLTFNPKEATPLDWNETVKDLREQDFNNMTDLFEMIPDKKHILDEFIAEQKEYEDIPDAVI